jgi:hypothetical protein
MLAALVLSTGLFQLSVQDPVRGNDMALLVLSAQAAAQAQPPQQSGKQERQRFEEKFNRLIDALADFQKEYNAGHGSVWPAKKAEALKKAIKELPLK